MFYNLFSMMRLAPSSLLGAVDVSWTEDVKDFIDANLAWILGFLTMGMMVYGIYLGINIARAENSDKAQEAKKRLVHFAIGVVIGILLLVAMYYLLDVLPKWFPDDAGHGS